MSINRDDEVKMTESEVDNIGFEDSSSFDFFVNEVRKALLNFAEEASGLSEEENECLEALIDRLT